MCDFKRMLTMRVNAFFFFVLLAIIQIEGFILKNENDIVTINYL